MISCVLLVDPGSVADVLSVSGKCSGPSINTLSGEGPVSVWNRLPSGRVCGQPCRAAVCVAGFRGILQCVI